MKTLKLNIAITENVVLYFLMSSEKSKIRIYISKYEALIQNRMGDEYSNSKNITMDVWKTSLHKNYS